MAEGRMLKKKISLDEAIADLADDTHRLLFTVGLAHLDIDGRISGDPREFKAAVAPMLDHITREVVSAFFQDAERLGLIRRYRVEGRWVVQYPAFAKNQTLRPDKEAKSQYPPPPDDFRPGDHAAGSGVLPEHSGSSPGVLPDHSGTGPDQSIPPVTEGDEEENLGEADSSNCQNGDEAQLNSSTQGKKIHLTDIIKQTDENNPGIETEGGGASSRTKFGPAGLVKLWNDLGCRPMVSELTDDRRKKASLRLRKRADPDWWARLFEKARALNRSWLNFDFLMRNDTNCLKVLEGNYDHDWSNRGNGGQPRPSPGGADVTATNLANAQLVMERWKRQGKAPDG